MIKRKSTQMIILHCSATREGQDIKAKDIKQWHKQRGFETIGYHYVIDLDGTIEKGRDEIYVGAHCTNYNAKSIGICYIGGCDNKLNPKDTRTEAQKKAMLELVDKLLTKYKLSIDKVYGHYQFQNKACPSFKIETFKQEYKDYKNHTKKCPYCGHAL